MGNVIGGWAFLIGVVLAIILGAFGGVLNETIILILFIIGIIVGLLNVTDKETGPFLMAGTVLVIVSSLGSDVLGKVNLLEGILDAILILFVPATVIVALKSVFSMAKS